MEAEFRQKLLAALALDIPYPERSPLQGGRAASVLFLFGYTNGTPDGLAALITRRTDFVGTHKGQMAFPGGVSEPDELGGREGRIRTALRETEEEVGIPPAFVEVLGTLPALATVSGFEITPVVGLLRKPVEQVALDLNTGEIAEALWVPLSTFLDPGTYGAEFVRLGEVNYPIHVYQVQEHRIWGATGSMIKNLLDRLQSLG